MHCCIDPKYLEITLETSFFLNMLAMDGYEDLKFFMQILASRTQTHSRSEVIFRHFLIRSFFFTF